MALRLARKSRLDVHPVSSLERDALQSLSGWVPLLLALLHELQAPASPWSPYFTLWPELGRLEHPMFW